MLKKKRLNKYLILFALLVLFAPAWAQINIVAAENSYAQVAQELGGKYVQVRSLMPQANIDPHLFTADASQAKALAKAEIVVFNGANYDAWLPHLLSGTTKENRHVIEVAKLLPWKISNPHLWYDPRTMPLYAKALSHSLQKLDPKHGLYFAARLAEFKRRYRHFELYLQTVKAAHERETIIMAEPLFEPMADYLELQVLGKGFAKNIMNEATPTAKQIAEFEQALRERQVKVLIYNKQLISPLVERMRCLAKQQHIPVIGMSETQSLDQDYTEWMKQQVQQLSEALNESH